MQLPSMHVRGPLSDAVRMRLPGSHHGPKHIIGKSISSAQPVTRDHFSRIGLFGVSISITLGVRKLKRCKAKRCSAWQRRGHCVPRAACDDEATDALQGGVAGGFKDASTGLPAKLPLPPRPPSWLYDLHICDYAGNLMLSLVMAAVCVAFSLHSGSTWMMALAGACTVPLIVFQHDVCHARRRHKTHVEDHASAAIALLTGTYWGAGCWNVHVQHHGQTGDYHGEVLPGSAAGDLDDLLGPLRKGNPFGAVASSNAMLRTLVAGGSILLTMSLFQLMFLLQAFTGLSYVASHASVERAQGAAGQRAADKVMDSLTGALITAMHLYGGLSLLGPMGYAMYSIGISVGLQSLASAFHPPSGVTDHGFGASQYFERQVASTSNLAHHDNPLVRFMLMGNDFHIEHHLWEEVPVHNLPKLAPLARRYCAENGLEYREVSLLDAWKAWAEEAWNLAGQNKRSNRPDCRS